MACRTEGNKGGENGTTIIAESKKYNKKLIYKEINSKKKKEKKKKRERDQLQNKGPTQTESEGLGANIPNKWTGK